MCYRCGILSTRRINTFALISKEVANGDFTREVPVTSDDEIGQLGKTFNVMISSIKRMIEQLKDINAVAVEIHSHIEIERLLQDLVNISKRMIGAESGVLALLDETGEKIKHFKVSMQNPSEPCHIKGQPEGKGLLGMVIKKGQTIRLDNVANNPVSVGLPINHPPIHTLLGVPIKIDHGVVGGLLLANKTGGGQFTRKDEEILLTITYQAAVAIENAKLYDEVQRLAITDGLTGLLNHKEFYRRLNEHIEGSKRYQYAVSLLMIDIDHFKHERARTQLSVSIGVACFPKDADNEKDLIKKADEALYTAKRGGRNRVCCYNPAQTA